MVTQGADSLSAAEAFECGANKTAVVAPPKSNNRKQDGADSLACTAPSPGLRQLLR